ncbi:MAG: hypothetical protein ABFD18_07615 [Syntrophomonas sp.]
MVINSNRSPWMALLWSLTIPGFGQLYNGDYLIGLALVLLEFIINVKSNLNLTILYSFRGQYLQATQIADFQWLLFYPCVYSFSLWQAYNKAKEINYISGKDKAVNLKTYGNGIFIGSAMGGTLGVIYGYGIGPVLGGLAGMAVGALVGVVIDITCTTTEVL